MKQKKEVITTPSHPVTPDYNETDVISQYRLGCVRSWSRLSLIPISRVLR